MVNKDIYDCALRLLAESIDPYDNEDYEERAPFLLAAFCAEAADIDTALRRGQSEPPPAALDSVYLSLEAEFPLLPRLASAASLYLASMLVIDGEPQLSDRLYDKYSDAMSRLCASSPAICERISDRYLFN